MCNSSSGEQKNALTHTEVLLLSANRDPNLKRRDLIRPDLNKQYALLCNPSTTISTEEVGQGSVATIIANQIPFKAGGLQDSLHMWEKLPSDPFILDAVTHCQLNLTLNLSLFLVPPDLIPHLLKLNKLLLMMR